MLRLFQAFLESAPQLVLQLYILIQRGRFELENDLLIALTACFSLVSMIWAILAYSKSLRDFRTQPCTLTGAGLFFQFLWRVSMVTSRVVAMVLFASYYRYWLFVGVGAHWLIMTLWLIGQRTRFFSDEDGSEHPIREKLFNVFIGFMHIFCFFNTREGTTRKRVVLYYSVILVENSLFVSMWYPHRTIHGVLALAALGVIWGGFGFGVLCMLLYYRFYHPSLPVQGIFVQKRKFELGGQTMYTLVCCSFCPIKGTTLENSLNQYGTDGLLRNCEHNAFQRDHPAPELAVVPRTPSRELLSHSESGNHSIRGGSASDSPVRILVHSTPLRTRGLHTKHPLVKNDVPEIVVTVPTPEFVSPRDSFSNSSLVTLNEFEADCDDGAKPSPHKSDMSEQICSNTSNKRDGTSKVSTQSGECAVHVDTSKVPERGRQNCRLQQGLDFHEDTNDPYTRSPTAGEIISWFHPSKNNDNVQDEDDDDRTQINYGSLSFGHRYSLVSSDCISLSSESSRSSLDSIVLTNEDTGRHGEKSSVDVALKPADEGIFSDDRDSSGKGSVCAVEDVDRYSQPSQPQKPGVNAQFAIVAKEQRQNGCPQSPKDSPVLSSSNEVSLDTFELLMDASFSPFSSLKNRGRNTRRMEPSKGTTTGDNGIELKLLSELEHKEQYTALKEGMVPFREDGHESETTDASSDSFPRGPLHHSCDEMETGVIGIRALPTEIAVDVNKRHTFDFSQLSQGGSSSGKKKRKRQRRFKKRDFDNFVITSLRPGKYSSLRRSIDRLARIQEDTEESFLFDANASLNACRRDMGSSTPPTPESVDLNKKVGMIKSQGLGSSTDTCSRRPTAAVMAGTGSERANYVKRKRLKRFLTKDLIPGKFSSVRCSDEVDSSDEDHQHLHEEVGAEVKKQALPCTLSADNLLSDCSVYGNRWNVTDDACRKKLSGKAVSLPDVFFSTSTRAQLTRKEVPLDQDESKHEMRLGIRIKECCSKELQNTTPGFLKRSQFNNKLSILASKKRHDSCANCRDHAEMTELREMCHIPARRL